MQYLLYFLVSMFTWNKILHACKITSKYQLTYFIFINFYFNKFGANIVNFFNCSAKIWMFYYILDNILCSAKRYYILFHKSGVLLLRLERTTYFLTFSQFFCSTWRLHQAFSRASFSLNALTFNQLCHPVCTYPALK